MQPLDLLTSDEMRRADQAAIAAGTSGFQLMEAAGQAVADAIRERWSLRPVSILCGPGNNGGDGFVVARILHSRGWPVRIGLLGAVGNLRGDARAHAALWTAGVEPLSTALLDGAALIVDALFGTGLTRPLDSSALQVVQRLGQSQIPVCAVDIPSGVSGTTGQIMGAAARADVTVTFFRKKPGHLLIPGRSRCGELVVASIGIPDSVLPALQINAYENQPALWLDRFPWPKPDQHKYKRGHVLIRGGAIMTGAARLSALAAARAGAGLVSIATTSHSWPVYAAALTSVMVLPCDDLHAWQSLLSDPRRNVAVIGPGAGASEATRNETLATLSTQRTVILDADALTAFADHKADLYQAIQSPCVLTPHEGEFSRLFDVTGVSSKLERVRHAARRSGAVVVLKGADTVIAAPDGRAAINSNAPPDLATGGTGDVLTGIIAGLAAQGMDVFNAAAAAVWVHGRAASLFGPGLIADDLPQMLTHVLTELKDHA